MEVVRHSDKGSELGLKRNKKVGEPFKEIASGMFETIIGEIYKAITYSPSVDTKNIIYSMIYKKIENIPSSELQLFLDKFFIKISKNKDKSKNPRDMFYIFYEEYISERREKIWKQYKVKERVETISYFLQAVVIDLYKRGMLTEAIVKKIRDIDFLKTITIVSKLTTKKEKLDNINIESIMAMNLRKIVESFLYNTMSSMQVEKSYIEPTIKSLVVKNFFGNQTIFLEIK